MVYEMFAGLIGNSNPDITMWVSGAFCILVAFSFLAILKLIFFGGRKI